MTKEDRDYCRKHGWCTRCGEVKADKGYHTCATCRKTWRNYFLEYRAKEPERYEKQKNNQKARYYGRKTAGLCVRCGKRPPRPGKTRCEDCANRGQRLRGQKSE